MNELGKAKVLKNQALKREPKIPMPLPINIVNPIKDPRFSAENNLAISAIHAGATTPAPIAFHNTHKKNNINARTGLDRANMPLNTSKNIGILSRKNPHPTAIFFTRNCASVILAENNWGKNQPADMTTLTSAMGNSEDVNLLINKG